MKFKETLIKYNELQTKTANSNLKQFQFFCSRSIKIFRSKSSEQLKNYLLASEAIKLTSVIYGIEQ
jgi:hypothetical protein